MLIGNKDKHGEEYHSLKDIWKIDRLLKFFRIGFYISLIIWMCGICFSMFSDVSVRIKIAVTLITLVIYIFFVAGKSIVEDKWRSRINKNIEEVED